MDMAIKILINGLLENDSGKTWFTVSLYNVLKKLGYRVGLYKPISGHDGWRQFNTIIESIDRKILLCGDVIKYMKYTDISYSPDLINPIDFLLVPTDFKGYRNISDYLSSLEDQYSQTVLIRISNYTEESRNYYKIPENYNRAIQSIKPWIDKLYNLFNPITIDINQLFNILSTDYVDRILEENLKTLDRENDYILIEAFNNISIPYKKLLRDIDGIVTITRGYVIKPRFNNTVKLLEKDLKNYILTETLLRDAGIDMIIQIPPSEDIDKLSSYIMNSWSIFKKLIPGYSR